MTTQSNLKDTPLTLDLTLPCIYCGAPVSITSTYAACSNEECQDKEVTLYDCE